MSDFFDWVGPILLFSFLMVACDPESVRRTYDILTTPTVVQDK